MLVVRRRDDLVHELLEAHVRIDDDGLHRRHVLEGVIETDGVEDAGNVDTGGQQVDGYGDVRVALVAIAADGLERAVGGV